MSDPVAADTSTSAPAPPGRISSVTPVAEVRAIQRATHHPADSGAVLLSCNPKYLPPHDDPALARERSQRDVATRVASLLHAAQGEKAQHYLTSFTFLAARLALSGTAGLLTDFQHAFMPATQQAAALPLLHDALALVEPILRVAPSQLPEQLLARLPHGRDARLDQVRALAQQFKQAQPWLRPVRPSFAGPGQGLRRVLERHRLFPSAVAFSPDQALLLSADDHEVLIWDLNTFAMRGHLTGHADEVTELLVTPDQQFVVAALRAPCLFCWPFEPGAPPRSLAGHTGAVLALLSLPDGRILSAGSDGKLLAWSLPQAEGTLWGDLSDTVHALALFPDQRRLLSASGAYFSGRSKLTVWDIPTQRMLRQVSWKGECLDAACVTGDGRQVLAAANQNLLRWRLPSWRGPDVLGRHHAKISALAGSSDGRWAASADTGGDVRVWDLQLDAEPRVLRGHRFLVQGLAVSAGGQLATAGSDLTVRLWDFPPPPAPPSPAHDQAITRLAAWLHRATPYAISASQDGTLALWNLEETSVQHRFTGHTHWVSAIALTTPRKSVVSASWDGTLRIWDLHTGKERKRVQMPDVHPQAIAVGNRGAWAAIAPYEGPLQLWDLRHARQLAACDASVGQVNCLALLQGGRRLLAGGAGLACLQTDGKKLRLLGQPLSPRERVQALAVFPSAPRCLLGTASGNLLLLDHASGQVLACWHDSASGIADIAISACERWAVTVSGLPQSSSDDTVRVWDCQSGQVLARFIGDCPLTCCSIAGKSHAIAVGDSWGRLHTFVFEGFGRRA